MENKAKIMMLLDDPEYFKTLRQILTDDGFRLSELVLPKIYGHDILSRCEIIGQAIFDFFFFLANIFKIFKKSDLFICTGFHTIPFLFIHVLSRNPGKILIINFYLHELGKKKFLRRFLSLIFGRKVHLILQSKLEQGQYKATFPKTSTYFVPYCQDEIEESDPKYRIEDEGFIFAGGYSNRDFETLIKAAERLSYQFKLACSRLNRLPQDLPANVRIYRDIPAHEFFKLMAKSRIVVINLKEQLGSSGQMVTLSALSFKKPIIYSLNEAISHYFLDGITGISYKMGDVEDLINKIKYLMTDDEERTQIGVRGYAFYKDHYRRMNQDKQILEVIRKIVISGSGGNSKSKGIHEMES